MFAYKTNSPQYLDYIASVKSRKEIEADPDLCLLLENPYIKDNMEMAIRWAKAKTGDYQDKYDFLEYFMCNGPELDADTILHYRAKSFNDPVVMEIAYSYFSSPESQREIREKRKNKFGKNLDDCFQNPCFYLGRFTPQMGALGDETATEGIFTYMANLFNSEEVKKRRLTDIVKRKLSNNEISTEAADALIDKINKNTLTDDEKKNLVPKQQTHFNAVGNSNTQNRTFTQWFKSGCAKLMKDILDGTDEFANELIENTNCITNANNIGDWMAHAIQEKISIITKANVKRRLGDCARLWSQLRNFNMFDPTTNKFGPISFEQTVDGVTPIGTRLNVLVNGAPNVSDASATVSHAADATAVAANTQTQPASDNADALEALHASEFSGYLGGRVTDGYEGDNQQ